MSHKKKANPVALAANDAQLARHLIGGLGMVTDPKSGLPVAASLDDYKEMVDSANGLIIKDPKTGDERPATEEEIRELAKGEEELHTTQPFTFELLNKIEQEMGDVIDDLKAGLLLQIEAGNVVKSDSDALRVKAQKDLVNREIANARKRLNHMAGEVFNIVSKKVYGDKACTMVGDEDLMPELA